MSRASRGPWRRTVPALLRRTALAGCVVLGAGLPGIPAAAQTPAPIVVGAAGPACPHPAYPTVIAAVAAAPAGATLAVCAGTYPGTVEITKPVTLRGARAGVDARTGRTDPAAESVIDGAGRPGVHLAPHLTGVTIDGFTVRGAGAADKPAAGIDASAGSAGFSLVNTILTDSSRGLALSSDGSAPDVVSHNRIVANNRNGPDGGAGILFCCGAGRDVTITENAFGGHTSAAVNTAGDPAVASTKVHIDRNTSVDDSTFALVVNAAGATVEYNAVRRSAGAPLPLGNGILVGGNTNLVSVKGNEVAGGVAGGIRISAAFGPPNTGFVVVDNTVAGRRWGIRLSGQTSGSITGNRVSGSTEVGILLDADDSSVAVTQNTVLPGATPDCHDLSTGTGTAGTANTWTGNVGATAAPEGICGAG